MSKIQILPEALINKIAAGEVVERPASVVKELMENALDAGSDQIFVTIKTGGKDFISVLDNGGGMTSDDARLAIERHATSKILTTEDLESINTMGFRGEALAAIAAVSRFELTTCGDEEEGGFQIRVESGKLKHSARVGFPKGTRIIVENLFFNTPARQKFMKSVNTEYNHIHELVLRLALGHPNVQFRLTHNKTVVLNIPKGQDFIQRIQHCFGSEIAGDLMECNHTESYLSFQGLISQPSKSRSSRRWQHTFVNDRYVKCKTINHGIYEGYKTLLMKNTHPMFFMKVDLPAGEIDVNVHPAKTEIRLKNPNLIHTIVSEQISRLIKLGSRKQFFEPKVPENSESDKIPQPTENRNEGASNRHPNRFPSADSDSNSKSSAVGKTNETQLYTETNEQMGFLAPTPEQNQSTPPPSTRLPEFESKPSESATDINDSFSFARNAELPTDPTDPDHWQTASSFRIIGQLHNKYILAQGENKLIMIDQHAAHERIRFEEIKQKFYSRSLEISPLLIPIMMELPPQDGLLLEQHQDSWKKLGFVIDHFGGNDYSIKEIPAILKDGNIPQVIREVLDEMALFGKSGKLEEFFNEVFERMACHSAIRAAQTLSIPEMQSLLDQVSSLDLQLHCPHGRPILIEIGMDELDKRFKR
ncbi:MAG: DNA mismatch repair endonuclease MutL [Proteobacteria bacterium]|nr:DNA mismatch repair endonuclease MutL [Pseudomonadota bacterium]